jgi:hypothetical protein
VSLDTHEAAAVHVAKHRFVGPHFLSLIQKYKYFIALFVRNDSVGLPAAIRNQQGKRVVGGWEATQCLPGLCEM